MNLDQIYRTGYRRAWSEDAESQERFCSVIAEVRSIPVSVLKSIECFFVPNEEYLVWACGEDILDAKYGVYLDDNCLWSNCLLLPILNLNDQVMGLAGFNPFVYMDVHENLSSENYYQYSMSSVFAKGRYMFGPAGVYKKSMRDGYLCITDGVFDTVSLNAAGFNAMALMGSTLTQEILMQLRFIKKIILVADNDDAGYKLWDNLRKSIPGAVLFKQGYTKDADEALKSEHREDFIRKLREVTVVDKLQCF